MKRAEKTQQQRMTLAGIQQECLARLGQVNHRLTVRYQAFLSRRPHRSFRRTYRRDYIRTLRLPGYIAFTHYVSRSVLGYRRMFILLTVGYAALILLIGGVTNQSAYIEVNDLMQESSQTLLDGGIGKLGQAGMLLLTTIASSGVDLSVDQQIYLGLSLLMTWLITVWLLRELLLGGKPRLRDGIYTGGAPIVSTLVVLFILMVQLLPVGIVALLYAALSSVGIINEGFAAMLFWVSALAVVSLVAYWVTSTVIALVIVTLPGMYPLQAMRAASDLVIGRRLRIMYRWAWAATVVLVTWTVVMVPAILLDGLIGSKWEQWANVPFVPLLVALMASATVVWLAAYVYLMYRKIVDDTTLPA